MQLQGLPHSKPPQVEQAVQTFYKGPKPPTQADTPASLPPIVSFSFLFF